MEPFHALGSLLRFRRPVAVRGYTLIEMLVVLAIIGVLVAVIFVSQSGFNRSLLLSNAAYTVALSLRESQSLGLSSEPGVSGISDAGVGLDFSASNPTQYTQFADTVGNTCAQGLSTGCYLPPNGAFTPPSWCPVEAYAGMPQSLIKPGNCVYDPGGDAILRQYTLNDNYTLSFATYKNENGVETLFGYSGHNLQSLDIVFMRPNTQTVITGTYTTDDYGRLEPDLACIEITSPEGESRYVEVTQLGEVSVTETCP